jgi:hypothetical protein
MAQSRTAANNRASAAEPMQELVPTSLVPGQSKNDVGGDTPRNAQPDNDSAKLDPYKGAPGSVSSSPEGKIGDEVIPGNAQHDGTKPGRSNPGPEKLDGKANYADMGPGKGYDPKDGHTGSLAGGTERRTVGQSKTYEHVEVDEKAGQALDELATDNGASDDFKSKAKVIFESALNQKLQLEVTRLEEEFSSRFEEEITQIAEKVEGFLNYTSQQWLEENKLVVENGIRNELSESFMQGLRGLFEDHYVTLPDEKYDIFESMVAKLDDMENKLNEQIETNVKLANGMSSYQRDSVLADVSWDLTEAGKERLAGLAENVEFESEENYRTKLNVLKESFITKEEAPATEATYSGELLEESAEAPAPGIYDDMSSSMAAYARALSRTIK